MSGKYESELNDLGVNYSEEGSKFAFKNKVVFLTYSQFFTELELIKYDSPIKDAKLLVLNKMLGIVKHKNDHAIKYGSKEQAEVFEADDDMNVPMGMSPEKEVEEEKDEPKTDKEIEREKSRAKFVVKDPEIKGSKGGKGVKEVKKVKKSLDAEDKRLLEITRFVISLENHKTDGVHIHAMFVFNEPLRTTNPRFFDINLDVIKTPGVSKKDLEGLLNRHPKISKVSVGEINIQRICNYCKKDGDFINKGFEDEDAKLSVHDCAKEANNAEEFQKLLKLYKPPELVRCASQMKPLENIFWPSEGKKALAFERTHPIESYLHPREIGNDEELLAWKTYLDRWIEVKRAKLNDTYDPKKYEGEFERACGLCIIGNSSLGKTQYMKHLLHGYRAAICRNGMFDMNEITEQDLDVLIFDDLHKDTSYDTIKALSQGDLSVVKQSKAEAGKYKKEAEFKASWTIVILLNPESVPAWWMTERLEEVPNSDEIIAHPTWIGDNFIEIKIDMQLYKVPKEKGNVKKVACPRNILKSLVESKPWNTYSKSGGERSDTSDTTDLPGEGIKSGGGCKSPKRKKSVDFSEPVKEEIPVKVEKDTVPTEVDKGFEFFLNMIKMEATREFGKDSAKIAIFFTIYNSMVKSGKLKEMYKLSDLGLDNLIRMSDGVARTFKGINDNVIRQIEESNKLSEDTKKKSKEKTKKSFGSFF